MIERTDVAEALAMLTGYASDKTPTPSEVTIQAWTKYFAAHPHWTGDDLVAAAHKFAQDGPWERLVQPADIGQIIAGWYRERLDRMDPDERADPWGDIGGTREIPEPMRATGGGYVRDGVRHDRYGYIDKSAPDDPPYPADWNTDQRLAAYWQRVRGDGFRREGSDPTLTPAPSEHPPGAPCPECGKPSTFGPYCAKHYVLSFKVVQDML
jgi:hypothetical protein